MKRLCQGLAVASEPNKAVTFLRGFILNHCFQDVLNEAFGSLIALLSSKNTGE